MFNPLEQFTIRPIIRIYNEWVDLTITNSTIMLLISVLIILLITKVSRNNKIIVNKWERFVEILYIKIEEIVVTMLPGKPNEKYIPLIVNIFLFILLNNLIGLIPYSFTTTSHMAITLTLSLSIIIGVTFIGFKKHSIGFFKLFIPSGLNQGFIRILIPLIFVIELISYLTRIISLSVRLTANMMSGHTLLKIIANFGLLYTAPLGTIFLIIPLIILIPVVLLELGVAVIQAYVFTMLTASYIKDAELLH